MIKNLLAEIEEIWNNGTEGDFRKEISGDYLVKKFMQRDESFKENFIYGYLSNRAIRTNKASEKEEIADYIKNVLHLNPDFFVSIEWEKANQEEIINPLDGGLVL